MVRLVRVLLNSNFFTCRFEEWNMDDDDDNGKESLLRPFSLHVPRT